MKLSIIIPTRNRGKLLEKALSSILELSASQKDFEVIVVDNGSTDKTKEICNNYKSKIRHFVYAYNDNPGLHVGRHEGLKLAKADILSFLDDDVEVFSSWLEGVLESFKDPEVVMLGGKNLPKFEKQPPSWLRKMWDLPMKYGKAFVPLSILDFGDNEIEIDPDYIWGCNFSIRKKTLLDAGGFHPDSMPPELICLRGDGESHLSKYVYQKKLKAIYNPKASIYHFVPKSRLTKEYLYKRSFNQGVSNSYSEIRKRGCCGKRKNFRVVLKTNILKLMIKIKKLLGIEISIWNIRSSGNIDGYIFHSTKVASNPQLLNWVLKPSYFESNLPKNIELLKEGFNGN